MAKIQALPGRKIIDGFKGVIDFYLHDGVPCARRWPRNFGRSQTPASVAQQPMFTYAAQAAITVSPIVQQAYVDIAGACGLHWKDWFMRGYISGIYKYPIP